MLNWFKKLFSRINKGHRGIRAGDHVLVYWKRTPYVCIGSNVTSNKVIAVHQRTGYKVYEVEVEYGGTLLMHEGWVE